jgi:hypothetical protein
MNKIHELFIKFITYRWNYAIELLVFVAIVIFILTA